MEIIIILSVILQSVGIALGVGSSTLAIINFFVAIADDEIDADERRMMGVVYVVLRVAMGIILITTGLLTAIQYALHGYDFISPFLFSLWLVIIILFGNSILMSKHIIPSTLGPAIQASSWYTVGVLMSLSSLNLMEFTLVQFLLAYATVIFFAVYIIKIITVIVHRNNKLSRV